MLTSELVELRSNTPKTVVFCRSLLQEFCKKDTKLRLIIATNAFGLGVDCADIARIIHWGSPNTLKELAQETGRDGCHSEAILHKKFGNIHQEQ